MKRDMEVVRAILLAFEESEPQGEIPVLKLEGWDQRLVEYNVRLLMLAAVRNSTELAIENLTVGS